MIHVLGEIEVKCCFFRVREGSREDLRANSHLPNIVPLERFKIGKSFP